MPTPPINTSSLAMNIAQFKGQALSSLLSPGDALNIDQTFNSILEKYSSTLSLPGLATSTVPTGLDSSQPFSTPGQNMVTVLNRIEVSFKAQYSELDQLKSRLLQ
jgi:hypothetical protein